MSLETCISEKLQFPQSIVNGLDPAYCVAVGLINSDMSGNHRQVVDQLARLLDIEITNVAADCSMLLIRLDVQKNNELGQLPDQPSGRPKEWRSPLGNFAEVEIPMPIGSRASWSLEHVPHWLPAWKRTYNLILLDLGPIREVPSRTIGRLCDFNFLILGPRPTGSVEWLLQQIAWHQQCGSSIVGSILASKSSAARDFAA